MLPHTDPRYIKWLDSLKKRPPPWCVGKTKETDPRVNKISETFKRKKIDNFSKWRVMAKFQGLMPSGYPVFEKNSDLAFLVGLILGDGHLHRFPRTERLEIALGTDKPDLINFVVDKVFKVIGKDPQIRKVNGANCVKISLYQKNLSKRLGVPIGKRKYLKITIPTWIRKNKSYLLCYLRGLYEAEAYLSIHLPTCTYNFAFVNYNKSMLRNVEISLKKFGLHPEIRPIAVRLRKREEVKYFRELIHFRDYNAG